MNGKLTLLLILVMCALSLQSCATSGINGTNGETNLKPVEMIISNQMYWCFGKDDAIMLMQEAGR